jgi:uncharacterized membrane protein YadS
MQSPGTTKSRNKLNDFFEKTFQLALFIDKLIFHKGKGEEKSSNEKRNKRTFPAFIFLFVSFLQPSNDECVPNLFP